MKISCDESEWNQSSTSCVNNLLYSLNLIRRVKCFVCTVVIKVIIIAMLNKIGATTPQFISTYL
jgi:hypothetical protein